jgi:signal transduction histidine kinase
MSETVPAASALVVDDESRDMEATVAILRKAGLAPETVPSGDEACELLEKKSFDLVVTDIVMRGMNGFDVIKSALKADLGTICIAVTSFGSLDSALDALRFGAYSFARKPLDPAEFAHIVKRGLEKRQLAKELLLRNNQLQVLNLQLESRVADATRELQELNRRVLTEMASLKEVDQLKSAFLGNVSHDLRSPLTTMRGYVSYLLDLPSFPEAETRQCLDAIGKAEKHMSYLVAQLLEQSQLTAGTVKLAPADVSARELLDESAVLLSAQAKEAGLELRVDVPAGLTFRGDRGRLLQVLSNLAGNACKFTPRGGKVALSARSEGAETVFCVEDTGPGIPPEHREKIFERFFQSVARGDGASKGLGLGLHIAKDIVALHGGRIWVESELGKGSRFLFAIPRSGAGAAH